MESYYAFEFILLLIGIGLISLGEKYNKPMIRGIGIASVVVFCGLVVMEVYQWIRPGNGIKS